MGLRLRRSTLNVSHFASRHSTPPQNLKAATNQFINFHFIMKLKPKRDFKREGLLLATLTFVRAGPTTVIRLF